MSTRDNTVATTEESRPSYFSLTTMIVLLSATLLGGLWLLTLSPVGPLLAMLFGLTDKTPWYFTRATGTVAYLLLAGSTVWGLLLSTKIIKDRVPAVLSLAMHNILSWLAIAFTGLHALALLFDSYYSYALKDLFVPFLGPYRPGSVGLGIVSLYIMVITSTSFYAQRRLGQKWWKRIHYSTFVAFALVTLHGLLAGTDSGTPGMRALYLGSTLVVLVLTNLRILAGRNTRTAARQQRSPAA